MIQLCFHCRSPLWQLGGDPDWQGLDHSKGKPGTVILNDDETLSLPACLTCANDRYVYKRALRIMEAHPCQK